MADIVKPLKDLTNADAKDIILRMTKQALHDELNPLLIELKRIAAALEGKAKP